MFIGVRLELSQGKAEIGEAVLEETGETLQIVLDLVKETLKVLQQREQLERKDL